MRSAGRAVRGALESFLERHPWVIDAMSLVRNLGLSGMDLNMPAGSVQVGAMAFVAVTYAILTVQESVEDHMFMQDEGNWHSTWVIFDAFTSAVATVLFMPVTHLLNCFYRFGLIIDAYHGNVRCLHD